SSVLDNLGSGGPIHRIQRKANLHPTPSHKSSQCAWELEWSNGSKMDSEVVDDDKHSTASVQGNAPTTNAASTLALPVEPL
nr:hypothetical protein [Tanacetum cinerariifolium]